MAAFVAEHNLPFSVMDQLSDLFKEVFPDSAIAVKFKSKHTRTHSSKEIQNGANRNSAERKFQSSLMRQQILLLKIRLLWWFDISVSEILLSKANSSV